MRLGLNNRRTLTAIVAALALSSCLVVGVASAARNANPVLNVGFGAAPNLDPSKSGGTAAIFTATYAPLFDLKPNGTPTAGLATSWHYLPAPKNSGLTNKVFEFTLRKDARFSDGSQVTAGVVAAWLSFFYQRKGGFFQLLGPNPTFAPIGKWTVKITTEIPTPNIPLILGGLRNWGYVASLQAINNPALLATGTYGAGPYMVDPSGSVAGDHYKLVPNPYYYAKSAIKYSEIDIKVITVPSSMLQALQAGQLDIGTGDASTYSAAKAAGFKVASGPGSTILLVLGDTKGTITPALADVRVRQAINYGIDRKAIVAGLFGNGLATPTSEMLASDVATKQYQNYYSYNPTKAKALLAAAGYSGGFTTKVFAFTNIGLYGDQAIRAAASTLDQIGIHFDITSELSGRYLSGQFPLYQINIADVPLQLQWPTFAPGSIINVFHTSDPTVNHLFYAGLKLANPVPLWQQMYGRLTTQAYFMPICNVRGLVYYTSKVGGVVLGAGNAGLFRLQDLTPAK